MKYIIKIENFGDNIKPYKVNDYILYYDYDYGKENNGKIIDLFHRKGILYYEVAMVEGEIGIHTSILENEILRLLTSEEIRNIEIRNNAKKYNI